MSHVELGPGEARKLALVSQGFTSPAFDRGRRGAREVVEHLGYVQIDTISVVTRAHHHTLWARVPGYRPGLLDRLVADREVFEYWAHAAAYLPIRDFRFCLPRMRAIAAGQRHWFTRDLKLMREVLARFRAEGELRASDFDDHTASTGLWEWGPVKRAIEQLFMEGRLLVSRRENFQKVFDLAERILPDGVDTRPPDSAEYARHLVEAYLRAHGIARTGDFGHLRKGMGPALRTAVAEGVEAGSLRRARIPRIGNDFVVAAGFERPLAARVKRDRAVLLSPFDNLVIQRDRVRRLFDFDYQLECYVPAAKRRHGYFCLPLLWRGRLAARADCKADRGTSTFKVKRLAVEDHVRAVDAFSNAFADALARFATFNDCEALKVGSVVPARIRGDVTRAVAQRASSTS